MEPVDSTSTRNGEAIGAIIAKDKDVSSYARNLIWSGTESDFKANNKGVPAQIMRQKLHPQLKYAFRGISGKELETIVTRDGIGGNGYQGTVARDGALFDTELAGGPLAMFDGRTYGGTDDRYKGGYIIAIPEDAVKANSEPSPNSTYKVVRKIPLNSINAIFRIDRMPPNPDSFDSSYRYNISQIVPKSK